MDETVKGKKSSGYLHLSHQHALCSIKTQLQPLGICLDADLRKRTMCTVQLSTDMRQGEVDVISVLYLMASY